MVHCPVPATLLCQGRRLLQAGGEGLRRERAGQHALSVSGVSREDFRFQQEDEATGGVCVDVYMHVCVCMFAYVCALPLMYVHTMPSVLLSSNSRSFQHNLCTCTPFACSPLKSDTHTHTYTHTL